MVIKVGDRCQGIIAEVEVAALYTMNTGTKRGRDRSGIELHSFGVRGRTKALLAAGCLRKTTTGKEPDYAIAFAMVRMKAFGVTVQHRLAPAGRNITTMP